MKRQEYFLFQRDLSVDWAHVTSQRPVQASIEIPLHSDASF